MRGALRWPRAAFAISGILLSVILVADLETVGAYGRHTGIQNGTDAANADRFVLAVSIVAYRGDHVSLPVELIHVAGSTPPLGPYSLFVTEAGGRDALLAGGSPAHVYARVDGLTLRQCCDHGLLRFVRQDGPTSGDRDREPAGSAARLDVVWVFSYEASAKPANAYEARAFEQRWGDVVMDAASHRFPSVVSAWAAQVQPVLDVVEIALAGTCVVAAIAYAWGRGRAWSAAEGSQTEALLRAHALAGDVLEGLRDLLVAGLVSVALLAATILASTSRHGFRLVSGDAAVGSWTSSFLVDILLQLVDLALLCLWVWMLVRVQRALRQWRRRRSELPASL